MSILYTNAVRRRHARPSFGLVGITLLAKKKMKRSHSTAELPVFRPLVPATSDDTEPPVAPAPEVPAPMPSAEPNATQHAPMTFPGPFAYVPKPATMEEGDTKPGSASSASSVRAGSGEAVMTSSSPAATHSQPHSEPAPAAGGSTTAAAGAAITHATAGDDNPHGFSPLILAALKGRLAEVKLLLEDPAVDIDQVDQKSGATALIAASVANKPEVAAFLLANGAKINFAHAEQRRTALMEASSRGHVEVVKALLARKDIAIDATDVQGRSALFFAACANRPEVVACLLAAGAKVDLVCGKFPRTALMEAAACGYVEVVIALLACQDIALDATDAEARSALFFAADKNKPDVAAFLLHAGASMTIVTADRKTAVTTAIAAQHAAVLEVLLQHGAPVTALDYDYLRRARPSVAFAVTLADLDADRKSIADPEGNPLWLAVPNSLDDAHAVIDELLAVLESKQDLQQWLWAKGIRIACVVPVVECLASLAGIWPVLANSAQAANAHQKRLVCAAALSRLSVLAAEGKALAHYQAAGISAAGMARLSAVATRQIEKLIAVSEQVLTSLGGVMLDKLVSDCLAGTNPSHEVEMAALNASLVSAGWLPPLAQAIAMSWKAALAALESEPVSIPAGSTMKQITQLLCDNIERKAPQIFAQAMQRALAAPTLLAALRTWIGDAKSVEGLDLLFQIQCDQLRQYCEQIVVAG
jgi:ankyrin repeat protein